ncbi:MAG TPA: efflux RND transporter periplasmic adaptor subunit [Terriglobales bacterium]|nr:efflux RND transporter periplasmic adaptor subunit [Terriglobales bacterium]
MTLRPLRWERLGCAGVLMLLALAACNRAQAPSQPQPEAQLPPVSEPVVEVQTMPLRRGVLAQHISAPGSVMARRESRIGAEVSGRIERVHVSEGDRVAEGDLLFEIDSHAYEVALRQAEAGLDLAQAERRQLEADLVRARTLRRNNVMAEQEIERLSTTLAVATAKTRQASEAVALARENLRRTRVHAPFAGSVASRLADEGTTALVQPQTIVIVLQETAALEAQAAIPESQMALVRIGDAALVHIEGLAEPVRTNVSSVSDNIDAATRTYLVKMPVPNNQHRIKAGVFAQIDIDPQDTAETLLAPRAALRLEDGRTRLLVVRDGRVEAIPVDIGAVAEEEAEIVRGAGVEEIAIVGDAARNIAPGMRVRAAEGSRPAS